MPICALGRTSRPGSVPIYCDETAANAAEPSPLRADGSSSSGERIKAQLALARRFYPSTLTPGLDLCCFRVSAAKDLAVRRGSGIDALGERRDLRMWRARSLPILK